jgi:dTDP-4-amino-4,6-dideoxygalactose transaminase
LGSSYPPSDLLAAFLYAQLGARDQIQTKRRAVWERYFIGLQPWAQENGIRLPVVPSDRMQAYHMFYILLPSLDMRQKLVEHLRKLGIMSVFHYQPLHLSNMGQRFGGKPGDCPVTEATSERLLRLPFFNDLDPDTQDRVIAATCEFTCDRTTTHAWARSQVE